MTRARVAVAVAIALGAMALVVLWQARRDPWQELATALARSSDPARGRLALIATSPSTQATRSSISAATAADDEILTLAGAVLASSSDDHQRALAAWVLGNTTEAERRLRALSQATPKAEVWNDLAVVLANRSATTDDETLIEALAAADRAIDLDPALHAARFNRAWIIERIGLRRLARDAYDDYCRIDGTSAWAAVARERIRSLEAEPSESTTWSELAPRLLQAGAQGDPAPIVAAVNRFPQEARGASIRDVLTAWGAASASGNRESALANLNLARQLGQAIQRTNGDAVVADAVAAIDAAADDPGRLATLADAHATFGSAAALYQERRIGEATPLFQSARALFERAGSPAALHAELFCASAEIDVGSFESALGRIGRLVRKTPERYAALRAETERLRGTVMAFEGFVGEALVSFQKARTTFVLLGEVRNTINLTARIGAALAVLGRPGEAWPMHRESLRSAGANGAPRLIQSTLHAAMYLAVEEARWDLAHALLNLEVDVPAANPRVHAEAVVWRALTAHRARMNRTASSDLTRAKEAARAIADPTFRESAENDLRLVEAMLLERDSPEAARALLTEYMAVAEKHRRLTREPQALLARARILRTLGRTGEAEVDLRESIRLIEERRGRVSHELLRDTFLVKSASAYAELADLLDSRGEIAGAVEAGDLPRARLLLDRSRAHEPFSIAGIAGAVQEGSALLAFLPSDDHVTIHLIARNGVRRFSSAVAAATLRASVDRFTGAVKAGDEHAAKREGRSLYDALLGPAAASLAGIEKLIVVADAPLDRIPFGALVQPHGRFVIEDYAVTMAPGIRAYAGPERSAAPSSGGFGGVANPRIDRTRYPELSVLPAAEKEGNEAAAMYPEAMLLVGHEATRARTLGLLRRSRVLHLATHAIADPATPEKSRLMLADGDALTAADIAAMNLENLDTVVLAGCRTASAGAAYGYLQNLATAFLAAGAHHVIGSLWDVEDTATRDFSLALHRALSAGIEPDRAMRQAQLAMIDGPIRNWAALQMYAVR